MAYLLYGIAKAPGISDILTGVRGKPVIFIEAQGLCAAVSEVEVEEGAPPVADLLAYAQVVEALHRRQAVVPMRYGCFLNGIPAIQDILTARRRQYETLLAELAGHVEMGIRILLPEKEGNNISPEEEPSLCSDALPTTGSGRKTSARKVTTTQPKAEPAINGRAYLALRKVHYRMQEETSQSRQALIDRYILTFSGLYARHRTETDAKKESAILSLYFLTPENTVNRFRETFGYMMAEGNDEAMLSGPWPPYNFVTADPTPAK